MKSILVPVYRIIGISKTKYLGMCDLLIDNGAEKAQVTLSMPPDLWQIDPIYIQFRETAREMKVVNNCADRGVALIQTFNSYIKKDEKQKQYLFQVIKTHRKAFPEPSKRLISKSLKSDLPLVERVRTIQRVIISNPLINREKLKRKPVITQKQKEARLEFIRNCIQTRFDWDDVVWSDEKKFNLDGPDENFLSRKNFGGIMV